MKAKHHHHRRQHIFGMYVVPTVHDCTHFGQEDGAKLIADFLCAQDRKESAEVRHYKDDEALHPIDCHVVHVDNGWASGYVVLGG